MATYNGEKFLNEQIESIVNQTYKDWKLYIHDDMSSDKTVDIIKSFCKKEPYKILYLKDEDRKRGAAHSFMWLLNEVNADYYMFCDQDDVWLEDKIEKSLNKMKDLELKNPNTPILIHTDLCLVDEKKRILSTSFWEYKKYKVDISKKFNYIFFCNIVTGCTAIINNKLKELSLPMSPKAYMHDYWLAIVASKYGILDNIKEQTILYRQHSANVLGGGRGYKPQFSLLGFVDWYKRQIPIMKEMKYGTIVKILYYRVKYQLYRLEVL